MALCISWTIFGNLKLPGTGQSITKIGPLPTVKYKMDVARSAISLRLYFLASRNRGLLSSSPTSLLFSVSGEILFSS